MKLKETEFSNWMVELRDGAFEIQRNFQFGAKADMDTFVRFIGRYMKSPSLTVCTTTSAVSSKPEAHVRIHLLPERALLKAAGEIAATCENEYTLIQAHVEQFAA